jgi:hypothetical protein
LYLSEQGSPSSFQDRIPRALQASPFLLSPNSFIWKSFFQCSFPNTSDLFIKYTIFFWNDTNGFANICAFTIYFWRQTHFSFLPYLNMLETRSPSPYPCYHQPFFFSSCIPHDIYSIFECFVARRLFLSSGKEIIF